ncbi:hypothetical protein BH10PLA2_BH10PLA2_00420 [soil metagenome]
MSDDASPRLALPFLVAGQAQKEMVHNEALQRIDALVQPVAQSADLAIPPATPMPGDCWIVADAATGAWVGHDGELAQWTVGGWRFLRPAEGWRCHIFDRGAAMRYDGTLWINEAVRSDGIYIDGDKVVGSRMTDIDSPIGGTVVDSEGRSVINELLTVLRTHGLIG